MQFWDEIINTAMLGTGKKMPGKNDLPGDIAVLAAHIEQQPIDKEEQFLQMASLAFNVRQSGVSPLVNTNASINIAATEEKPYCNEMAMRTLGDVLEGESISLLQLWLNLCNKAQQIIAPSVVPVMLQLAAQHKKMHTAIVQACGKRGEWLCQFNKDWNFKKASSPEDIWQTGTLDQRKQALQNLRETDAATALLWLQQTWLQEDANTRAALLETLYANIGVNDEAFLESLSTDKSKKVRDEAMELLKHIPTSDIVQSYKNILQQAVTVKKEKTLLGLSSKKVLDIALPGNISEDIFKTGIDKLSSQKNITDDAYILYQLASYVPPSFWEQHLESKPEDVIDLLQKSTTGKQLLPAIAQATARFKDITWAGVVMKDDSKFYIELLPLLTPTAQDAYMLKHFEKDHLQVISYAASQPVEWSYSLSASILQHAAKNPYSYNKSFFNQVVHLIPVSIAAEVNKFAPPEQHLATMWLNTAAHISQLLNLKSNIFQSFKA